MLSRTCLQLRLRLDSRLVFSFSPTTSSSFPPNETRPLSSLSYPSSSSLHYRSLLSSSSSRSPLPLPLHFSRPSLSYRYSTTETTPTTEVEEEEEEQNEETKSKRQREREEKEKKRQKLEEQKGLNEKIQNCLQLGKVGKAEEQLQLLDEKGLFRDEDTSTLLIKAYCLLKEQDNVRGVVQTMKRQKIPFNVVVFNAVLQMHCDNGHVMKAKKTLQKVYEEKLNPNIKTYKILLSFFLKTEDWENAIRVTEEIKTRNILPDSELMAILINLHNALGEERQGLGMLLERHRQIQAEIKAGLDSEKLPKSVFLSIFDSYLSKGDIAGAEEVVKTMAGLKILPTYEMFDKMLCVCVEFRDKEKLDAIFKQMKYFGFYPSPKQFVSLLQLCEEKKKERIAGELDGEMEVGEVREVGGGDGGMAEFVLRFYENIGEGKEKLDVFPLLMALQIHFTNQDMGKFEKRLSKIEKTGAISRSLALKLTLFRYLRTQDILGAEAMKEYIKEYKDKEEGDEKKGVTKVGLDLETFNSFLDFYAIAGNEKKFFEVFREEMQEEEIQPDTSSFNSYLRLLSRVGPQENVIGEDGAAKEMKEKIEEVVEQMKENKVGWDYQTYYFLLKLNVQFERDAKRAEELMKKMKSEGVEAGKEVLVLLLRLYAMSGEVEKAEVVLGLVERLGEEGGGKGGWVSKGVVGELVKMYAKAGMKEKGVEVGSRLLKERVGKLEGEGNE